VLGDTKPLKLDKLRPNKMKILQRKSMSKYKHAKTFRRHGKMTKSPNTRSAPQRGGWRL
jgi:hypothetical protein